MSATAASVSQPARKNPIVAALLSLIIPGAGQLYLGARNVAFSIFATVVVLALLVYFTFTEFDVGLVESAGIATSWLWLLFGVFWLWNVWDAYARAQGRGTSRLIAFGVPILLIYIIAWQVTDVNMVRLFTRFSDVRIIFNALIHPDLFTRATEQQSGQTTIWVPCTDPPQTGPMPKAGYSIQVSKTCATVGDTLFMFGEGFLPDTTGNIYWQEYNGTNEVQVRADNQPVTMTTGPDGRFGTQFAVPNFAARDGLDPANPTIQGIEARFVQEVGPPKPSENFEQLIGTIEHVPAPDWMVSLGIVPPGGTIPVPVPGKIFETIALGLMATILSVIIAIPLSFFGAQNIMSRVRGGSFLYYIARGIFNITRSIDTLIWAIIFVVWVGLGAFAGLLALTLHSIAAVAKLYSEEIEHIDPGPLEASTAAGASLLQTIRYTVIPQIVPPFLAYSLLRWDINMRSATVVGFVSAAGVGFMIVESIRKGGYEIYAAALWCIAIVVIIVDYLSSYWRQRILVGESAPRAAATTEIRLPVDPTMDQGKAEAAAEPSPAEIKPPVSFFKTPRGIFYSLLFIAIVIVSWNLSQIDLSKLLEPAPTFVKLVSDFVSLDTSQSVWESVLRAMLTTIFQALLATTLGAIAALPFAFLAARNITGRSPATAWIYSVSRFILNFLRSIEAILYVAIFVFWVGIGAFAGMLALSITTFGLIGKLFSEAVENIEEGPVEAVTATGANRLQSIAFAIVPQIIPPFISYAIYQWDINIRLATIIGFAGGGGIGLLFQNYTGQLQYHKAGVVILAIVVVVTLMDFASAKIREQLV